MGLLDLFKGANPEAAVAQGAVTGVLDGIGTAANSIREAITGKLSADDQGKFDMAWQTLTQKLQEGQQAIDLADANSGSNFRGGWRPALGWTCAIAIFSYFVPPILMATLLWTVQCFAVMWKAIDITKTVLPAFPISLSISDILGLVASLLGMATLRSVDKNNGVASK
jgi:hypothetical protein